MFLVAGLIILGAGLLFSTGILGNSPSPQPEQNGFLKIEATATTAASILNDENPLPPAAPLDTSIALEASGLADSADTQNALAPVPSSTPVPAPTSTPLPIATATAAPAPTSTPVPAPTSIPTIIPPPATPIPATAVPATATAIPPTVVAPPPQSVSLGALELELFQSHNVERAKVGVGSLQLDPVLVQIARQRAQDMADNNYFAHASPSGETAFTIMNELGYFYLIAGENIARNNYPNAESASVAMDGFMNSQGHRDNILDDRFNKVGVGLVIDSAGMKYFAIIFAGN